MNKFSENIRHGFDLGLFDSVKKRASKLGKKHKCNLTKYVNSKKRKIEQLTLDGIFLNGFESITQAAKQLNLSPGNIHSCISGKYKHCGGYIWRYSL